MTGNIARGTGVVLAALLLLGVALTGTGFAEGEGLVVPEKIDFGNPCVGETVERDITIQNKGATPATFNTPNHVPKAIKIETPLPITVEPGETKTVRVSFSAKKPGHYVKRLHLNDAAKTFTRGVLLEAEVVEVTTDVTELDFGEVEVGSEASQTVIVKRCGNRKVLMFTYSPDSAFAIGPERRMTAPDEEIVVSVFFRPKQVGDAQSTVRMTTQGGGSIFITVRGKGFRRVSLLPDDLNFGKVSRNVIHTQTTTLANHTDEPVAVNIGGKLHAEYFTVSPVGNVILQPFAQIPVNVNFGARGKCKHKGRLEIRDDKGVVRAVAPVFVQTK